MTTNTNSDQETSRKRSGCGLLAAVIALLAIGFLVTIIGLISFFTVFRQSPDRVMPKSTLCLEASDIVVELATAEQPPLLAIEPRGTALFDILAAIRRAKEDDHIDGIYFQSGDLRCGFAKAMEIRQELLDFKSSGKTIYAFIEWGDELDYYFASTADTISMAPEAMFEFNGFGTSALFWRGALDKLGIELFVDQHEDYKSAAEVYSRQQFSKEARETLRKLLMQRHSWFIEAISASRNLTPAEVENGLSEGLYTAKAMLEHGLIDAIEPKQKVHERIKNQLDLDEPRFVCLNDYIEAPGSRNKSKINRDHEIAVVVASGTIVSGDTDDYGPLSDGLLASENLIQALRAARDNDRISAIVLRIDSPGGSVLAADEIWQEIREIRKDKPVFASMSDVAASGGYYIAIACDTIIAHPATLTGSIGVISAIPNFSGLLAQMDITVDTVKTSRSAVFLDPFLPFAERDRQKFSNAARETYFRFVEKTANARRMSFEQARDLAKGRVWVGQDAYENSLVDSLGGLWTAIEFTKDYLNIPADERVRIHFYPEPEDLFAALRKWLPLRMSNSQTIEKRLAFASLPQLWMLLRPAERAQLTYLLQLAVMSRKESTLMALPFSLSLDQ